jgi:Ca2+-binding EF-hand superfamily protein
MELTLEGVQGVPEGGILSVKIGEVRRQAPLTKIGQPFRFSSSPVEALPLKYEVLVPVAPSRSVMLDPLQKSVVLEVPGGGKIKMRKEAVESLQRPVPNVAQIADARTSNDKKQMAATAANYLEQHGLVRIFQDLLHGLLVSRPEDPWFYLDEHLARAKAVARTGRSNESAVTSPQGMDVGAPEPRGISKGRQRGSIVSRGKVDALMDIMMQAKKNLPLILPYLPQETHDMLVSPQLVGECEKQFRELDGNKQGKLRAEELLPVLVQLSTANAKSVTDEQCRKFAALFDTDENGTIDVDEFVTLTQFVIIAAYLESDEGREMMAHVQFVEESNFSNFLDMLAEDKDKINDVVPFLPDWLVGHLISDEFLDECMAKFDELDADGSQYLDSEEIIPIVINLSGTEASGVDLEKCKRFLKLFDVDGNGVIQRDEFLEFAQFLAVTNFLSESTEGRQIHEAALHQAEVKKCDELLQKLEAGGIAALPNVLHSLPYSIRDEMTGDGFARECREGFLELDVNKNGSLDHVELIPLMIRLAEGHPFHLDEESCKKFTAVFDKDKNGVISAAEFVDLCKFVIVMGYLQFTKDWRETVKEHSHEAIEEMFTLMKEHRERLPEILPLLPSQFLEEITSYSFTKDCLDHFAELDKDGSGTLEPKELVPCVIDICQVHPVALTKEQCLKFVDFFDTEGTGVISRAEFIDFVQFMVIMSYLEDEDMKALAAADNMSTTSAGEKKVEELLYMLEHDRDAVHKIVPLLPEKVFDHLTSDEFVRESHAKFVELDVSQNNVLTPDELFPVIVELSSAKPYAVDLQQCRRFTAIFDMHGDGVIRLDEFLDFARFMCIMQYLHSEEGKDEVGHALQILSDSKQIEDLIVLLERDWHEMKKVIPYLPDDLRDELLSEHFTLDCLQRFEELDRDCSGSLDPSQVLPIIVDMTNAHHHALDESQCARFVAIFDEAKTGVISKQEFVNFARFLMVMSFLQTEKGQSTLELAIAHHHDDVPNSTTALVSQSKPMSAPQKKTDLDFYKQKTEELEAETKNQKRRLSEMEAMMKAMQEKLNLIG